MYSMNKNDIQRQGEREREREREKYTIRVERGSENIGSRAKRVGQAQREREISLTNQQYLVIR